MKREKALKILSSHRAVMERQFHVKSLALFGSTARDEAGPKSDVDLLVAFHQPPGFDGYMALKWYIEELLKAPVDLVMDGALRPEARPIVEAEAVHVA